MITSFNSSDREMATALRPFTIAVGCCRGMRYIDASFWVSAKKSPHGGTHGHIVLFSTGNRLCGPQPVRCAVFRQEHSLVKIM